LPALHPPVAVERQRRQAIHPRLDQFVSAMAASVSAASDELPDVRRSALVRAESDAAWSRHCLP
jgi:hypothetical protein